MATLQGDVSAQDRKGGLADSPAVVALAVILLEGVVQGAAVAGWDLGSLRCARATEVEGVWEDAQESDQAIQLAHTVLHSRHNRFSHPFARRMRGLGSLSLPCHIPPIA